MDFFIISTILGIIPAMIAQNKGRSSGLWWLYGSMLFIIALPHSLIIESLNKKQCLFCFEKIHLEAIKCKYCGSIVPVHLAEQTAIQKSTIQQVNMDTLEAEKIENEKTATTIIVLATTSAILISIMISANSLIKWIFNNEPTEQALQPVTVKSNKPVLPPFYLESNESLAPKDGRRIQLNSNDPNLSKISCMIIIDTYRTEAGKEGQVSVHKPSTVLDGTMNPWCVDNLDGKGVIFNDAMFE